MFTKTVENLGIKVHSRLKIDSLSLLASKALECLENKNDLKFASELCLFDSYNLGRITFLEKSNQLKEPAFLAGVQHFRSAAIAAGASTPPEEIEEAKNILRNINISIDKETNNGKRKRNCKHNH